MEESNLIHPELFQDHRVLPLKYDSHYESCEQVFFKAHRTKDSCPEKPAGRTLFLSNVPSWCGPKDIRRIFQSNGPIDDVIFQRTPSAGKPPTQTPTLLNPRPRDLQLGSGFKYAYVVFERPSSIQKAMTKMNVSLPRVVSSQEHPVEMGVNKWRQDYNAGILTDLDQLLEEVEAGVAKLDAIKEKEIQDAEEDFENADEDGWVTVSRHTSKKPVGKKTDKAQTKIKAKENRKRKRKELEHFYKTQVKESKLRKLDELKAKFEQDKQKQIEMKKDRKFKPA